MKWKKKKFLFESIINSYEMQPKWEIIKSTTCIIKTTSTRNQNRYVNDLKVQKFTKIIHCAIVVTWVTTLNQHWPFSNQRSDVFRMKLRHFDSKTLIFALKFFFGFESKWIIFEIIMRIFDLKMKVFWFDVGQSCTCKSMT